MKRDSIEAEGNTIDGAIEEGLRELGVGREQARVEILSDAKRGLLGFGGQKARVRVSRRLSVEEKLEEPPSTPKPEEPPSAPVEPSGPASVAAVSRWEGATAGPTTARAGVPEPEAVTVLQGMLERMGIAAEVKEETDGDGEEVLRIESDAGGLLIGRHGRTLDALEYLVNRIVSRQEEGASRIIVDAEEYRKRRAESLRDMARRTAERVKKRTRSLTLTPMSPRDRRVVHVALRDDPEVSTRSIGRGYFRRIIVAPGRDRDTRRNATS